MTMKLLPAFVGMPEINKVYHIDALSLLRAMPDNSVHMVLTDPPYNTTECYWDAPVDLDELWCEIKRVLKYRGACVMTGSDPFSTQLKMSNWAWFKYSWIWVKSNIGDPMNAKRRPMKAHEDVLVFSGAPAANVDNPMHYYPQDLKPAKIKRKNHYGKDGGSMVGIRPSHKDYVQEFEGYPNTILSFDNDKGLHPTQKPVALFDYLIRTYTLSGQLVVDPFSGSGTTAIACRDLGRQFIVGDITEHYVAVTRKRLAAPYTPNMFLATESATLATA